MDALKKEDARWKAPKMNETSTKLTELWTDTASSLTVNYMRTLGLGNKKNILHPFQCAMMRRMTEAQSVCYSVPCVRRLIDPKSKTEYDDDSPEMVATTEAFERSSYDLLWKNIDGLRNLYRTIVVEWVEDLEAGAVSVYLFPPHLVHRWPSKNAPTSIGEDKQTALLVRWAPDPNDYLYRVWTRDDRSGKRVAFIVNARGELVDDQPFGNSVSPYSDTTPLQVVYDDHPMGQPWLPVPESRVAWALGVNAAVNDLALLIQLEAHTTKVMRTEQVGQAPKEVGPDDIVEVIGEKSDYKAVRNHPHIAESSEVIDQLLRLWALGEFLPGDTFMTGSQVPQTGQAMKVRERDLAARRARQGLLVPIQERAAWQRYVAIHNANARAWGVDALPAKAQLKASPGRSWQPFDPVELQNVDFRDLATGFMSRIDYAMERFGMTRSEAITHLKRVREDNKQFPLTEFQNPGAVIDQRAAAGPGSATSSGPMGNAVGKPSMVAGVESSSLRQGAMNPNPATTVEGASVTQAVVTNLSSVESPLRG